MPYITIDTYPPVYNEDGSENLNYDEELLLFTVPFDWFLERISLEGTARDFLERYTWDETSLMYQAAALDDVIISKHIVRR